MLEKSIEVVYKQPNKLLPLPDIIKTFIFSNRNITSPQQLDYRLENLLNPAGLKDLDKAVKRIVKALIQNEKIVIVGDYDADGATSTALLYLSLKNLGFKYVNFLIPDRNKHGYALSVELVNLARAQFGADLIITVDNGVNAFDAVAYAQSAGIDVVITDHHLGGETVPNAVAVLNPNQRGCNFASKNLVGVGVAFYLVASLTKFIREHFAELERITSLNNSLIYEQIKSISQAYNNDPSLVKSEADIALLEYLSEQANKFVQLYNKNFDPTAYLDLVAIGTIADLANLDYNNRILIEQGIRRIRRGDCLPAITAILRVQGLDQQHLSVEDISFRVAPLINAVGRLDNMNLGVECLLCTDINQAQTLALQMQGVNQARSEVQGENLTSALAKFESLEGQFDNLVTICLYDPEWHQGVVGLSASTIKERFWRPTFIFTKDEADGSLIKGSGRSISSLHLKDCLDRIHQKDPDLIVKFGGHAGAAGATIREEDFSRFSQAFDNAVRELVDINEIGKEIVYCDLDLPANYLTLDFARELGRLGPWGKGFPEPIFKGRFKVTNFRIMGKSRDTLKIDVLDANNREHVALKFKTTEEQAQNIAAEVYLYYTLSINRYSGQEKLNLVIRHIEPVESSSMNYGAYGMYQ